MWDQIRAQGLDQLVLTGDNVRIDAMPHPVYPKHMSDDAFAQHLFDRYQALLALPQFAALVRQVPTEATWNDHDFPWTESYAEQAIKKKVYRGLIRASRATLKAYCRAFAARLAPDSFPEVYNRAVLWDQRAVRLPELRHARNRRTQIVLSVFSFGAPSNDGPGRIDRNSGQPLPQAFDASARTTGIIQ